jgi:demethylmenaquinone methyltransferase/2-methoxy-6-polyprenyl-1,4-benzoquinol methylase
VQSRFYTPGQERAQQVRALFSTIAHRYDLLNDLLSAGLHRRWKATLVRSALHRSGKHPRILDLCCGTGDLAAGFLRREDGARITGVDFTAEMLRHAAARTPAVTWIRADGLCLPFRDGSFDLVSVGYGLRNLADLEAGLREILRVLRPGGSLYSLDFGKPPSRILRQAYFAYLRSVAPLAGALFCGDADAYAYILASLEDFPDQRELQNLMERSGFVDCGTRQFVGGTMAINFGAKAPPTPRETSG